MKLSEILINLLFGLAICCGGMFASTTVLLAYPVVEIEEPADTTSQTGSGVCGPINLVLHPSELVKDARVITACAMPIEAFDLPIAPEQEQEG